MGEPTTAPSHRATGESPRTVRDIAASAYETRDLSSSQRAELDALATEAHDHQWAPVRLELDDDLNKNNGTCWVVCLGCGAHSYIETWWVGHKVGNVFDGAGDAGA